MERKDCIEKESGKYVDCLRRVSDISGKEWKELVDKGVDLVLGKGFENSFVGKGSRFRKKGKEGRKGLVDVGNGLMGRDLDDDRVMVCRRGG